MRLGPYELVRLIGSGGMGDILLVRDRDLRRDVAMKVLHSDLAALDEQRIKFIAEAQATSQLEHPGIPPVHDVGLAADGSPWFTMKLVEARRCGRGSTPTTRTGIPLRSAA